MVTADRYLNVLDGTNYLRQNISKFKEVFIKYYGEEYQELIDEKFNNTLFITGVTPELIKSIINRADKNKTKEIGESIVEKSNSLFSYEELFGTMPTFNGTANMPIEKYKRFYEMFLLGEEERKEQFIENGYEFMSQYINGLTKDQYLKLLEDNTKVKELPDSFLKDTFLYHTDISNCNKKYEENFDSAKELIQKINPNITIDNFSEYQSSKELEPLNQILNLYDEGLKLYEKFMNDFSEYTKKSDAMDNLKSQIHKEYLLKFIRDNIKIVPKEKQQEVIDYLDGKIKNSDYVKSIFGDYSISTKPPLMVFNSENEKILKDENESAWKKQSIEKERIKYFKLNGIDCGNNYENYLNNEQVKESWPKLEVIDRLELDFETKQKEAENEFYLSIDSIKKSYNEIRKRNYLDEPTMEEFINDYKSSTCVNPQLLKKENEYLLDGIIYINLNSYDNGNIDHFICHELNHLLELSLADANDTDYTFICGWDKYNVNYNSNIDENKNLDLSEKREYELFNEMINEKIAQEISEIMQQEKIYVFDSEENASYKHTTSYEESSFIIDEFYYEFNDTIKKSRINNNISILLNEVGEENFEAMNNLFYQYYELSNGFKSYSLKAAIYNHEENEQTKKYFDIVAEKDSIMEKMRTHKESVMTQKKGI